LNAGVTFERVYVALKDLLGSARFAAGQHLEPAALSQDLNVSITPVRDALHRLAGEGLVDTSRGEGFRTPAVTEVGLRHLYRWNAALLDLALRARAGPGAPARVAHGETEGSPDPIEATEHLFLAVAERTGSPEHLAAIVGLNDRLRRVRQAELTVLVEPLAELQPIAAHLAEDAVLALRRSLSTYHRRRERLVGEIVASLAVPH
jgi:DNA-binding GntR family transcriptional regulator